MKAVVTSIGEPTTDMSVWALERNGFDVVLLNNSSLLSEKLKVIYDNLDEDFVRIDADVIVNKWFKPESIVYAPLSHEWWLQFRTYDWFKQDLAWGGAQLIKKEALPALRAHIEEAHYADRPETQMSRLQEFHSPRRFESHPIVAGINGYGIKDIKRVITTKAGRGQSHHYDFELAMKLNELTNEN